MMHICIFQTGEPLHIDKGNYRPMRCMLLTDQLLKKGHKVSIIASDFFHQRKFHRTKSFKKFSIKKDLNIYLIPSPGYKKHISLERVYDHFILAVRLYIFLNIKKKFKFDRVFLGYPPILTSLIICFWCLKNKIPFMLDVKDKWPEQFLEPFEGKFKFIAKKLLLPYYIASRYVFNKANKITSITEEYIDWIKNFSRSNKSNNIYFVSPLIRKSFNLSIDEFNKSISFWKERDISILESKYFCFVGSYTKSFDFNFIYKAALKLSKSSPSILFIICGSGDQYKNILEKFCNCQNVKVFGEIDKFNSKVLVQNALATIAPYVNNSNFKVHIPNKIIESLENQTPFITSIDGKLKKIIDKYNNGIYIKNEINLDISEFEKLINDDIYLQKIKANAKKSYKELFNFERTFDQIIENLILME
tara:strand:- start:1900 stop:3153 length:1254 start_codon:yes stop_codon:yes gene_type:complete